MPAILNLFIIWSMACVCGGWILSAIHQLNAAGYLAFFVLTAVGCWGIRRSLGPVKSSPPLATLLAGQARRVRRRLRRPLPFLFYLVAVIATLGGAAHAPSNYDAMTYRIPRMLHWCAAGGWHWINTTNPRQNVWAPDFEWLTTPIYLFTRSDRLFFLTNLVAFCLTPGLIFSVFRAAGVSGRVAWSWMWALPLGYCYVMEAASIGNDMIAIVYGLACVRYSLEAARTGQARWLAMGLFSIALATGIKATNLPLMLPCAGALWWGWRRCKISWPWAAAAMAFAALASFLPMAALNRKFAGDWLGLRIFKGFQIQFQHTAVMGIIGNSIHMFVQTFLPPVLPGGRELEAWLWSHLPAGVARAFHTGMPTFDFFFTELPQEERSGLGIGVAGLLVTALVFLWRRRRVGLSATGDRARVGLGLGLLGWISVFYFMTKLGGDVDGRVMSPYYPLLLLPLAIHGSQRIAVRSGWWRGFAMATGVFAVVILILTPSRPLWPAGSVLDSLAARFPKSRVIRESREVFDTYRRRNNLLGPLRARIPDDATVVGVIENSDDTEYALWRPLGYRRVETVRASDQALPPNVHWVAIKRAFLEAGGKLSLEDWVQQRGGKIVFETLIEAKVSGGQEKWALVYFPG